MMRTKSVTSDRARLPENRIDIFLEFLRWIGCWNCRRLQIRPSGKGDRRPYPGKRLFDGNLPPVIRWTSSFLKTIYGSRRISRQTVCGYHGFNSDRSDRQRSSKRDLPALPPAYDRRTNPQRKLGPLRPRRHPADARPTGGSARIRTIATAKGIPRRTSNPRSSGQRCS